MKGVDNCKRPGLGTSGSCPLSPLMSDIILEQGARELAKVG